jgi:hypothetical protein
MSQRKMAEKIKENILNQKKFLKKSCCLTFLAPEFYI